LIYILMPSCGAKIEPTAINVVSPTEAFDEKIALQESLIQALGDGNRDVSRLTKISYNYPERADITIIWTINYHAIQSSRIVNAQIDATNILKILEEHKTRFVYVILIGTFPIPDESGSNFEIEVIDLGFNKSKLEKVDWEAFQPSDIYKLADVAVIADEWK